jgi:ribosome recycling factor
MDFHQLIKQVDGNMKKIVDHTVHQFGTLHTGKASPQMVESVNVEVYGSNMKLRDVASITTPDARTIHVQPWDKTNLKAIEKAILIANLGINAGIFGEVVRCPLPELSRERRQELVKVAHGMAEEGRINIRNCRREAMETIKEAKKSGMCSEDDAKKLEKEVQKTTDKFIASIEQYLNIKERELTAI